MGRVRKHSVETIVQGCVDYLEGRGSFKSLANQLNVGEKAIRLWVLTYKKYGQEAFIHKPRNRSYTQEFKEKVAHEYIQGKGAFIHLAAEYNLSEETIRKWVQVHYNGGEQKAYDPKGEVYTMKSRKTTLTERIEIVRWVLDHPWIIKALQNTIKFRIIKFSTGLKNTLQRVKKLSSIKSVDDELSKRINLMNLVKSNNYNSSLNRK